MMMHAAYSPGGHRRSAVAVRLAVAMAIAGCAVAIGACGSSGGGQAAVGATTAPANGSPLGLSHCMRADGISSFPDPGNGPGGQGLTILATPGNATLTVQGITFSGPAFQRAEAACKRYLFASGPAPPLSASQRTKLVASAKCMRAHGVPQFADPTTGPVGVVAPRRATAYSNSPAFNHAVRMCGGLRKR